MFLLLCRSGVTGVVTSWVQNQWLALLSLKKQRLKNWLLSWAKDVLDGYMFSVHKKNKPSDSVLVAPVNGSVLGSG